MQLFCTALIELPAGVALNNHQSLTAGYQTWPASGTHLFVIVKAVKCTLVFPGLAADLPTLLWCLPARLGITHYIYFFFPPPDSFGTFHHSFSFSSLKPNRTKIIGGWWSKCGIINVHIPIPLESTPVVQQRCRESEFWMRLGLNDVTTLFLYYPSGVTVLTAAPALITLAVQSKSKSGNESIGGFFLKNKQTWKSFLKDFSP